MSPGMHRIAGAGNIAALTTLATILGSSGILLAPPVVRTQPVLPRGAGHAQSAVLIVLDGLRADTAFDERVMPTLGRLAKAGGAGTAHVECLIPSTVAGVTTIGTGQVASPVSFLQDFSAKASPDGGVFAAIAASGGKSAVAGPDLWTGRFEKWLTDCTDPNDHGEQDEVRLRAALSALRSGQYRLLVVHFDRTDTAEHEFTPDSAQYRSAAAWCDDALRQILGALPNDACLLVTSDHGAADGAGHGGPEQHVLTTPLVVSGPGMPRSRLPPLNQRDIPRLLSHALHLPWPASEPTAPVFSATHQHFATAGVVLAAFCAWILLASLNGTIQPCQHFLLNAALWCSVAVLLYGSDGVAMLVCTGALVVATCSATHGPMGVAAIALLLGTAFGEWRVLDAMRQVATERGPYHIPIAWIVPTFALGAAVAFSRERAASAATVAATGPPRVLREFVFFGIVAAAGCLAGGPDLASVCLLSAIAGAICRRMLASRATARFATGIGMLSVVVPAIALRGAGRTVSLSAIDVHLAFAWSQKPGGLLVAIPIVLLTLALPTIAFWLPWFRSAAWQRSTLIGPLAAGAGAALSAQALLPTLLLNLGTPSQASQTIVLDHQLRVMAETVFAFFTFALVYAFRGNVTQRPVRRRIDETGSREVTVCGCLRALKCWCTLRTFDAPMTQSELRIQRATN